MSQKTYAKIIKPYHRMHVDNVRCLLILHSLLILAKSN